MKGFFTLVLSLLFWAHLFAQQPTQTIRGTVMDAQSHAGVSFASIALYKDSIYVTSTAADEDGKFRMENIPTGRYTIHVKSLGYNDFMMHNLIIESGKEEVMQIPMDEMAIQKPEVVIKRPSNKATTVNQMALVSTRTFTVEETNRYAGSRGDPARMASNFAGVQGTDDSRNDIIVRGNSPSGLLYRLEDVNIPSPNHFAIAGTTGGPVSILNNKVIATSDFMTGAFPAEYGNSTAAVFDLRMRNGNNEKYEFTGQFGVLGAELAAEGPISKKAGSSFLFTYRNATLTMLQSLHFPIGTDAVPYYKDASFKLNFPLGNKSNLSFFGIGGKSHIDILVSNKAEPSTELYGQDDRDQYFRSDMFTVGTSLSRTFSRNTYGKITLASSESGSGASHELVLRDTNNAVIFPLIHVLGYDFREYKQSLSAYINHKFNTRQVLKAGIYVDRYDYNFTDSLQDTATKKFLNRWDYQGGNDYLIQPYVQYRYKFSEKFMLSGGVHAQYFSLTKSSSIEPRLGMRWDFANHQALSAGYGLHSQIQPTYMYFYHKAGTPATDMYNRDMGLTKAHHVIASYDNILGPFLRIKVETYYQYLFDVPVEKHPSSFSALNLGSVNSRFFPDTLVNTGTGRNYGLEFTLEKFFSKNYFFMFTGSLYDSKYKGSDGVLRNTDFNGHFATNMLAGREFKHKSNVFAVGGKLTWAGGKLYGPADTTLSLLNAEYTQKDNSRNIWSFPDYFRADLKLSYKINKKHFTHEIALDLVNLFGTKNVLTLSVAQDPKTGEVSFIKQYQLGFLPLFYYKLDFTQ